MTGTGSRNGGFTLCELMVVLAIISIMGTVGTVSLLGFKQRIQLVNTADLIKADLSRARLFAARHKGYVVFALGDGCYELFVDNGAGDAMPGDWLRTGGERLVVRREIGSSISVRSNFPGDRVRVRAAGRVRPGTFTLTDSSGSSMRVVVNVLGRPRIVYQG